MDNSLTSPSPSPTLPPRQDATSLLKVSLSFKNGETKTLERFFTARYHFGTPDAEQAELLRVFQHFDKDGNGKLSVQEITDSLEKFGILVSAADLTGLLSSSSDPNGKACQEDCLLDFPDFYSLYKSLCQEEEEDDDVGDGISTPNGKLCESDLRSAFDLFDKNHDNFISVTELQSVLLSLGFKEAKSLDECKSMISKVDSDGDGMVSFNEFKVMMMRRRMEEET